MVEGIEKDCDRRIRRAKLPATKAPRRVLVPVGGAGPRGEPTGRADVPWTRRRRGRDVDMSLVNRGEAATWICLW